ncbi:glycerate kinase [Melghirimyces algeriensis]|uniref:glycerate kinase n=1 Tax=Melghirimyces algeriensis TaxID=910412 RepID=UPI001157FFAD|nr:glycerate kinase [Melghirimyces algeriensis]
MPVRVVIAPDSFKGSMKSSEAAKRIQQGIQSVFPDWTCERIPVADGGEGTLDAILTATGGYKVPSTVQDPLGRMMRAEWGYCEDRKLAVIETAAASGLSLLTEKELDPYRASTFGTGQLVKEALDRGAQEVVLGLGGSATVDAGVGFFSALGVDFYNRAGMINRPAGGHLGEIEWMDVSRMDPRLKTVRMTIAFDVSNPLLGPEGAISIFGSQKGVQAEETAFFEAGMQRFAEQIIHLTGRDVRSDPGSGAAGGFGFALRSLLDVTFQRGFELIAELTGLERRIRKADMVITGEGKVDRQSLYGKVPMGISKIARDYNVPVVVFAGKVEEEQMEAQKEGISVILPIVDGPMSLKTAMDRGPELLEAASRRFAYILVLSKQ